MSLVFIISILIRLAATVWSAVVLWRIRDWRMGFLTLMLLMLAARQIATFAADLRESGAGGIPVSEQLAEIPGLAVSVLALLAVFFLERMLVEREATAKALRDSEALYHSLVEDLPQSIYRKDLQGRYTFASTSFCACLGKSREEILGKTVRELFPPREAAKDEHDDRRVIETAATVDTVDERGLNGSRQTFVQKIKSPLFDSDGRVIGIQGIFWDISDRRRAEKELLVRTAQLQAVQEQLLHQQQRETERVAAELQKVSDELVWKTRLATLGQMSAQIAHEIRNPLGAILNTVGFLKRQVASDRPQWGEPVQLIEEEVLICNHIINNLLEITRRKEPGRETIDLGRLVHEAAGRLQLPNRIRFQFTAEPDPLLIEVDPVQFRQVLDNLLQNAREALGPSGTISVTATGSAECDVITVRDTGPGIPLDQRGRIFELFFTTKAHGTGLGLGICRQIVEQHGGTISLLETSAGGTAFELRLPRTDQPL